MNATFLNGELDEDAYMEVPKGVQRGKDNQVCKLRKSMYGLKQTSRKFYEKLTQLLVIQG